MAKAGNKKEKKLEDDLRLQQEISDKIKDLIERISKRIVFLNKIQKEMIGNNTLRVIKKRKDTLENWLKKLNDNSLTNEEKLLILKRNIKRRITFIECREYLKCMPKSLSEKESNQIKDTLLKAKEFLESCLKIIDK